MKKIWLALMIPCLTVGFNACDTTNKPAENEQEGVVSEEPKVEESAQFAGDQFVLDTNLVIPEATLDANGKLLPPLPIGPLSDGTTDGFNIAIEYDGSKVSLRILEVADKVVTAGIHYALSEKKGFEIYLGGTNPDIYVVAVKEPFKQKRYSLALGGADPEAIDVKISKACPSYNPTQNPPALVGINDARTNSITKSNGMIGYLAIPYKVRIHAESNGGGYEIVFTSNTKAIEYSPSYKFTDLGVPNWGTGFKVMH